MIQNGIRRRYRTNANTKPNRWGKLLYTIGTDWRTRYLGPINQPTSIIPKRWWDFLLDFLGILHFDEKNPLSPPRFQTYVKITICFQCTWLHTNTHMFIFRANERNIYNWPIGLQWLLVTSTGYKTKTFATNVQTTFPNNTRPNWYHKPNICRSEWDLFHLCLEQVDRTTKNAKPLNGNILNRPRSFSHSLFSSMLLKGCLTKWHICERRTYRLSEKTHFESRRHHLNHSPEIPGIRIQRSSP